MALKEKNHKGNTMTDKDFVALILAGDEEAWHKFVEQYSDAVFYIARKWTYRDCKFVDESEIMRIKGPDGKIIEYCEETTNAYLWIFEQLRQKLNSYKGHVPLDDFVWSKLNSPNLFKDYLRHKFGRPDVLPKIIQQKPKVAQLIFTQIRMKKRDEQILRILRNKHKIELTLEELWEIKDQIYHNLSKAGLLYLVIPDIDFDIFEQLLTTLINSTNKNIEDFYNKLIKTEYNN